MDDIDFCSQDRFLTNMIVNFAAKENEKIKSLKYSSDENIKIGSKYVDKVNSSDGNIPPQVNDKITLELEEENNKTPKINVNEEAIF